MYPIHNCFASLRQSVHTVRSFPSGGYNFFHSFGKFAERWNAKNFFAGTLISAPHLSQM